MVARPDEGAPTTAARKPTASAAIRRSPYGARQAGGEERDGQHRLQVTEQTGGSAGTHARCSCVQTWRRQVDAIVP